MGKPVTSPQPSIVMERVTRQSSKKLKAAKLKKKRQSELFLCHRETVDRNDIVVHPSLNRIKIESDAHSDVVVKQEVDIQQDSQQEDFQNGGDITMETITVKEEEDIPPSAAEEEMEESTEFGGEGVLAAAVEGPFPRNEPASATIVRLPGSDHLCLGNDNLFDFSTQQLESNTLVGANDGPAVSSNEPCSTRVANDMERIDQFHKESGLGIRRLVSQMLREKDLEIQRLQLRVKDLEGGNNNQEADKKVSTEIFVTIQGRTSWQPRMSKPAYSGIRGMIDLKALLNCRLVCKQWKESIDKILQQSSIDFSMEPFRIVPWWTYGSLKMGLPVTDLLVTYKNKEKVEILLEYLLDVQRKFPECNPFPSRHLRIEIRNSRMNYNPGPFELVCQSDWRALTRLVSRFLDAFGKHIWHLTLDIIWLSDEKADFANEIGVIISTWLLFVPELKSLILANAYWRSSKNKMRLLQSNSFTYPCLKHLDTLIYMRHQSSYDFLCKFLKTNRHIRALDICSPSSIEGIRNLDFVNLSDVSLYIHIDKDLSELAQATWKLNKLSLLVDDKNDELNITFEEIAHAVHAFKNTLTILNLNANFLDSLKEASLILPELKYLRLVHGDFSCVNWTEFLQGMNKLSTFDLVVTTRWLSNPVAEETQKTFSEYFDDFWKANSFHDWNLFPFLADVKFTAHHDNGDITTRRKLLVRPQMRPLQFIMVKTGQESPFEPMLVG